MRDIADSMNSDVHFGSVAENYVQVSLAASGNEIVRGVREMCAFADRY
jgi:hypothetical protein